MSPQVSFTAFAALWASSAALRAANCPPPKWWALHAGNAVAANSADSANSTDRLALFIEHGSFSTECRACIWAEHSWASLELIGQPKRDGVSGRVEDRLMALE